MFYMIFVLCDLRVNLTEMKKRRENPVCWISPSFFASGRISSFFRFWQKMSAASWFLADTGPGVCCFV
ncbi:hypothetical protein DXA97_04090 [Clostridium sp. OF09-36]|nr:hypothetical protein DW922_15465 [Clostridium sp. AM42-4]RHV89351.1 hypothetical protein DXA97_04090 [Clostridium sp. OF09-36]HBM47023.1 hypothetical protein [Lachnoclostridium sp.]